MEGNASYATLDDVPDLATLLFDVSKSVGYTHTFHDGGGGWAFLRSMYEVFVNPPPTSKPWQDRKVLVFRDNEGKVLSSVIYWIVRPGDKGFWQWKQRFPPPTPQMGLDEALLDSFLARSEKGSMEHMGDQPHIYVECAVTLTDHQRKGYMSKLLNIGNQRADELDYPTFLLASAAGKPGYLKMGFEPLRTEERRSVPMLRKKKSERV